MSEISDILRFDVNAAKARIDNSSEQGKGTFPYQLNINLHGLMTFSPKFKSREQEKAFNPLERLKKEPFQPTTVARDENGYRIFAEIRNGKIISGRKLANLTKNKYDRKNKISEFGTWLKAPAINKIKNSILHKYYSSGGDYSNDLKFFTYTIQAARYFQIKAEFQETKKIIQAEKERDFRTEYGPFAPVKILEKWEKENLNPDQYFIKKFSSYLENVTKRKFNQVYSYVWVAEKTKKGVIHFHSIFDCKYLCAINESRDWSERCGMSNFNNSVQFGIDRRGGKIENSYQKLDPNGISAYLTKYVSKNDSLIFGRNYGMSRDFYKSALKGVQKYVNPTFVLNNQKEQKGYFIIDSPWPEFNRETNQYEHKKIFLPVKLLKTKEIEIPTGKIPVYTLICEKKEKLLKLIFPKLFSRAGHLFENSIELELV